MASKEVSVREWKSDGCSTTLRTDTLAHELPDDRNTTPTVIELPRGSHLPQGLNFLPACSSGKSVAIERYKAHFGQ
jgi:hypothetical protein